MKKKLLRELLPNTLLYIEQLSAALLDKFRCTLDLRGKRIDIGLLVAQARENLLDLGNSLGV